MAATATTTMIPSKRPRPSSRALRIARVYHDNLVHSQLSQTTAEGCCISLKDMKIDVDDKSEKSVKNYIDHCLRSYRFGCFLRDKMRLSPDSVVCSFPRIIDSIFQRVKKAE